MFEPPVCPLNLSINIFGSLAPRVVRVLERNYFLPNTYYVPVTLAHNTPR